MLLDLRPPEARIDTVALDAVDAVRALQDQGHPRPILLAWYPGVQSPYVTTLYGRLIESGIVAVPVRRVADAASLVPIAVRAGARVAVHLHWLGRVLGGARDGAEVRRRVEAFVAELDALRDAAVPIVWTVHNRLPHDSTNDDAQIAIRREVAARAALVHVMAAATPELVADQFAVPPERLVRIPHQSFEGIYPGWVGREEARRVLGIGPTTPVAGLVGALQPYKGLSELLDALPGAVQRRPGLRLLVGGAPDASDETQATVDRAIADPGVLIHPRFVPDDRVGYFLRAMDVMVLPYRRVLNSAVLMLALTFDVPAVVPRDPAFDEFLDDAAVVTYERGSAAGLAAAIDAALSLSRDGVGAAARALCARRSPAETSQAFAASLRGILDA